MPPTSEKRLSCKRCQFRKLKCSRTEPCSNCVTAGHQCEYRERDAKRRPVSHEYVAGLENRIAWLESMLVRLQGASPAARDRILSDIRFGDHHITPETSEEALASEEGTQDHLAAPGRSQHHYYLHQDPQGTLVFHGPTSIFHIPQPGTQPQDANNLEQITSDADAASDTHLSYVTEHFGIDLDGELVMNALVHFFRWQYPHFMFIYREAFLSDHFSGRPGRRKYYWSGSLLLAICALGLLVVDAPDHRESGDRFFAAAESILLVSGLARPCIPNVQAFLCLAYYEIGRGNVSKGWEYSGIAFRMAMDLGFQKDPRCWLLMDKSLASPEDIEIRRRIYWGCYVSDKLISLILGRPVSLSDDDAEVQLTQCLPDFAEMDLWLPAGFEDKEEGHDDARLLVPSFQMHIGLASIVSRMLGQLCSAKGSPDGPRRKACLDALKLDLSRWDKSLAKGLQWNRWVPAQTNLLPTVATLQALYHSIRIILNPEPAEASRAARLASAQDIIALLRRYRVQYGLQHAPLTFVYGIVQAAKVASDVGIPEETNYLLQALDECSSTWPLARDARNHLLKTSCPLRPASVMPPSPFL